MAAAIEAKLSSVTTRSAASFVTSVPVSPIAIPWSRSIRVAESERIAAPNKTHTSCRADSKSVRYPRSFCRAFSPHKFDSNSTHVWSSHSPPRCSCHYSFCAYHCSARPVSTLLVGRIAVTIRSVDNQLRGFVMVTMLLGKPLRHDGVAARPTHPRGASQRQQPKQTTADHERLTQRNIAPNRTCSDYS